MIFAKFFRSQDHTRSFVVDNAGDHGWEVREVQDDEVVKRTWLHDTSPLETDRI